MIGYAILKIPPLERGLRAIGALPPRQGKTAKKAEKKENKTEERQYANK